MTQAGVILGLLVSIACSLFPRASAAIDTADSVYQGGKIYTVDDAQPWAQALALKNGRFVFVGNDIDAEKYIGKSTKVIPLNGAMVMPGIHDAHTHLLWAGLHLNYGCRFDDEKTVLAIIATMRGCADKLDKHDWLVAGLFYFDFFPDKKPHKSHLDKAFPDRPVYLREGSFHHALLNSKALEIAGIDRHTKAPVGGAILKDEQGEPTGELVEAATTLVTPYLPTQTPERNLDAIRWAVKTNNRYGITSVQDASGTTAMLMALNALDRAGGLTLEVAAHLIWASPKFGDTDDQGLEQLIDNRDQYRSPHVNVDFIKMWIDGSPTPPYFTQADVLPDGKIEIEKLLIHPNKLNDALVRFDRLGLKTKLHVAGAGATRAALDAIQAARKANPNSTIIHELGHTNLVTPPDLARFRELNAIAEMSPSVWHLYGRFLGDPPQDAWEFGTLLKNGATMTIGTDWVVTPTPNLFPALQGMLDRDDESIDLAAALKMMTLNGAVSLGWGKTHGSITIGKVANFIVLDRNLIDISITEIGETKVLQTIFEGQQVFPAQQLAQ